MKKMSEVLKLPLAKDSRSTPRNRLPKLPRTTHQKIPQHHTSETRNMDHQRRPFPHTQSQSDREIRD